MSIATAPSAPAAAEITVQGTMSGENAVALLTIGTEEYTAKLGEKLPGGVRLISVFDDRVVFARGKDKITVPVGEKVQ
jgi:hypothetical protein